MTRRRRRREGDAENPRQKALALIELALDAGTSTEEGRTAAVRAVKFIDKYDLLSQPFQGNETVRAAMDIAETLTSSDLIGNAKTLLDQLKQRQRR